MIYLINKFVTGLFEGHLDITGHTINNQQNFSNDSFPFIVTPSKITYETGTILKPNSTITEIAEFNNYVNFYSKIKISPALTKSGWFLVSGNKNGKALLGPQSKIKKERYTPAEFTPSSITYGVLGAQRVYLLSHDSTGPKGRISLQQTLYGIPQDKFIGDEKSLSNITYPTVRGDELMILLRKIFSFVKGHVHAIATVPPIPVASGNGQTTTEIDEILNGAENSILNQNIRIN